MRQGDHRDPLTLPTLEQLEVRPMEAPLPHRKKLCGSSQGRGHSLFKDTEGSGTSGRSGLVLPPAGCVTWVYPSPFWASFSSSVSCR